MQTHFAVVFPGQGSQKVGMCSALAEQYPIVRALFDEASAVLQYDLWNLVAHDPESKLNQTIYTQPAMLVADVAYWNVWRALHEEQPQCLAGHSLGEYAAYVAAGVLDFKAAVQLVSVRAMLMQEAVPEGEGAMAVVLGLTHDQIAEVCKQTTTSEAVVEPVNLNAPGQIVIAGHTSAVKGAMEGARSMGAKRVLQLPVSIPSHSQLMKSAAELFSEVLNQVSLHEPNIPVINNVDVTMNKDSLAIRDAMVRQFFSPVRWIETIEAMTKQSITAVYECGPGKVLTGLNKRIDASLECIALSEQFI